MTDYSSELDDEIEEYINRISGRSTNMSNVIFSVLLGQSEIKSYLRLVTEEIATLRSEVREEELESVLDGYEKKLKVLRKEGQADMLKSLKGLFED